MIPDEESLIKSYREYIDHYRAMKNVCFKNDENFDEQIKQIEADQLKNLRKKLEYDQRIYDLEHLIARREKGIDY